MNNILSYKVSRDECSANALGIFPSFILLLKILNIKY